MRRGMALAFTADGVRGRTRTLLRCRRRGTRRERTALIPRERAEHPDVVDVRGGNPDDHRQPPRNCRNMQLAAQATWVIEGRGSRTRWFEGDRRTLSPPAIRAGTAASAAGPVRETRENRADSQDIRPTRTTATDIGRHTFLAISGRMDANSGLRKDPRRPPSPSPITQAPSSPVPTPAPRAPQRPPSITKPTTPP